MSSAKQHPKEPPQVARKLAPHSTASTEVYGLNPAIWHVDDIENCAKSRIKYGDKSDLVSQIASNSFLYTTIEIFGLRRGIEMAIEGRLAHVYDLVTTSVYLANDSLALTLNGTTKWPSAKELQRLGETRMSGSPARVRGILERVADAIATTSTALRTYINDHQEFEAIGRRMLQQWEQGIATSLDP
jgi:hypothetical protein